VEFLHVSSPAAAHMLPVVPRLLSLCRLLDAECDEVFRTEQPSCRRSWVAWITACIADYREPDWRLQRELAVLKWVMLQLEGQQRRWELERCVASLGVMRELLDTPDTPPFCGAFVGMCSTVLWR
jgi:hypothetical protein